MIVKSMGSKTMDHKLIQKGDIVDITFSNDGGIIKGAVVLCVPTRVGEMWYFKVDNLIIAQNPMSPDFDSVVKVIKEN